jgi:type IV pilus biogenesis protein CpaD/CtpE
MELAAMAVLRDRNVALELDSLRRDVDAASSKLDAAKAQACRQLADALFMTIKRSNAVTFHCALPSNLAQPHG